MRDRDRLLLPFANENFIVWTSRETFISLTGNTILILLYKRLVNSIIGILRVKINKKLNY